MESLRGNAEQGGDDWKIYQPPENHDLLTPSQQLLELCKLKFAVYAPEVDRLSRAPTASGESKLSLVLWTLKNGGHDAAHYRRQFAIDRPVDRPSFTVQIYTPAWESTEGNDDMSTFQLEQSAQTDAPIPADLYPLLDKATPWPGPPVSNYHYPDWVARRQACMEGRIPESLLPNR